jgi:hypothetical protein
VRAHQARDVFLQGRITSAGVGEECRTRVGSALDGALEDVVDSQPVIRIHLGPIAQAASPDSAS